MAGSGKEATADSLNAVIKASGVTVSAALVNAFAKALKGRKVNDFFGAVSTGAPTAEKPAAEKPAGKK